jgi:hypothetical protein
METGWVVLSKLSPPLMTRWRQTFFDVSTDKPKDDIAGREPETAVDRIEVVDKNGNPITPKLASPLRKLGSFSTPKPQTITYCVGATT